MRATGAYGDAARRVRGAGAVLLLLACGGCSAPAGVGAVAPAPPAGAVTNPSATEPAGPDLSDRDTPPAAHWAAVAKVLGRAGVEHDGVYTVTVPRDDWDVGIEGMPVPTAAGLGSVFHFYRCPCGKTNVVGEFCVADYEVNDVIDALRAGQMQIASVAPMLLFSRTNPQLVRFQAEGKTEPIAKTLREALRWTGKERTAPDVPIGKGAAGDAP